MLRLFKRLLRKRSRSIEDTIEISQPVKTDTTNFEDVAENSPLMLYIYDLNSQSNVWENGQHQAFFKQLYPEIQFPLTKKDLEKVVYSEDILIINSKLASLKQSSGTKEVRYNFRVKHRDKLLWLNSRISIFKRDAAGETTQIIGSIEDVTAEMKLKHKLITNEEKYRNLFELSPDGIIQLTLSGKILDVNTSFVQLSGYEKSDFRGKHFLQIPSLVSQDIKLYKNLFKNLCKGKLDELISFRWKCKDGQIRYGEARVKLIQDEKENKYILGLIRDISGSKKTAAKLRESEALFRDLFENSPVSLWEEDASELKKYLDQLPSEAKDDLKGYLTNKPEELKKCASMVKVLRVNKMTLKMFGFSSEDHFRNAVHKVLTEKSLQTLIEEIDWMYQDKGIFRAETIEKTLAGKKIDVYLEVMPAPGYEKNWGKLYVSIIDISWKKQAECELEMHRDHLQELVDSKTIEIEEKYKQLQHQYSIMVERELRIKELRELVSDLRNKLKLYEETLS